MSRRQDYLARAREVEAWADRIADPLSRESLLQAGEAWRLLADIEEMSSIRISPENFPRLALYGPTA